MDSGDDGARPGRHPGRNPRTAVERAALEAFGRRLQARMIERRVNASEVARAVWGTTTDGRGYTVARNRDRMSQYLAGRSTPTPDNLKRIADFLGTTPEDLAPDLHAAAIDRTPPELAMHQAPGRPDRVHLRVDKIVPLDVAAKIIALLS